MLADSIAQALPELRAEAEARMTSACVVTTPGEHAWDPASGTYIDGTPVVHYEGKCRLRLGNPAPQNADTGETTWAVDRGALSLPLSDPTSAAVTDGMTVTITANPNDPAMVGLTLTILASHFQTESTARRFPIQIVTRDAGSEGFLDLDPEGGSSS